MNEEALSSPGSGVFSPATEEMAKEKLSFAYEAPHQWNSRWFRNIDYFDSGFAKSQLLFISTVNEIYGQTINFYGEARKYNRDQK